MPSPFALYLFDLDGTLVQTAPEICDAVNDTLAQFSHPRVEQAQVERWIGHGTAELLAQAWLASMRQTDLAQVQQSAGFVAAMLEFNLHCKRRCGTHSQLYPHVREVLQVLRGAGAKLALVTNKESVFTHRVLDMHALAPFFDVIVCGDSLSTKKPDPQGIAHCLQRLGVQPERSLFVGDSSIDVATARAADVKVWALPYGYNMGQPICECAPDRVIDDLRALLGPIGQAD